MQTVVETLNFIRRAKRLGLTDEELDIIKVMVAEQPSARSAMTEFGKRLESTEQALDIAKGTAVPGAYRVSVYEDGELRVVSDIDEAVLSIDEKPVRSL